MTRTKWKLLHHHHHLQWTVSTTQNYITRVERPWGRKSLQQSFAKKYYCIIHTEVNMEKLVSMRLFHRAWRKLLTIKLLVGATLVHSTMGSPDANRLYSDLMRDYNKLIRPVIHNTDILTVSFGLKFIQLINVVRRIERSPFQISKRAWEFGQATVVVGRSQPSYHNKRRRPSGSSDF